MFNRKLIKNVLVIIPTIIGVFIFSSYIIKGFRFDIEWGILAFLVVISLLTLLILSAIRNKN